MGRGPSWRVPSRPCDSCKRAAASLFCRADSAFLCFGCDEEIHGANKLASRHERVLLCEVCEQAPAAVTCQADAASLCSACDVDIHSANILAGRHHRLPVEPLLDPYSAAGVAPLLKTSNALHGSKPPLSSLLFQPPLPEEADVQGFPDVGEIGNPMDAFFNDLCFDLDFGNSDELSGSGADGLVPVQAKPEPDLIDVQLEKYLRGDSERSTKHASFSFPAQSFTQPVRTQFPALVSISFVLFL